MNPCGITKKQEEQNLLQEQKMSKKKMRLGKVCIKIEYVVDLDNEDMVEEAKACLFEDVMNAVKYDEIDSNINVVEDQSLTENDIPDFLKELFGQE